MNEEVLNFINGQFDFEYEDQPDSIDDYASRIEYMWIRAKQMGITKDVKETLQYLVTREDPTIELNSYFLPGKHDLRDVLRIALKMSPSEEQQTGI